MKKQLFFFLACLLLYTLSNVQQQTPQPPELPQQPSTKGQFPAAGTGSNSILTYNIIEAPNNTYCYDVYADGRLMIYQKIIKSNCQREFFSRQS